MYDYMEEMDIDEMLGEIMSDNDTTIRSGREPLNRDRSADSKSSIHARQLTLWGVEP